MNRNVTATILIVLAAGIYVTFTRAKLAEVKAVRQVNDQYLAAIDNADKLVEVRKKILLKKKLVLIRGKNPLLLIALAINDKL